MLWIFDSQENTVRRIRLGGDVWRSWVVLLSLIAASPGTLRSQTQPATASVPAESPQLTTTSSPTSAPITQGGCLGDRDDADSLSAAALEQALTGRFEMGMLRLNEAQSKSDNPKVSAVAALLEHYVSLRRTAETQRSIEYKDAIGRIRRSILAQEYLPKLIDAGLIPPAQMQDEGETSDEANAPLYEKIMGLSRNYVDAAKSDSLSKASTEEAAELKTKASEFLETAEKDLTESAKLLTDDGSDYYRTFQKLTEKLRGRLHAYKTAWVNADIETEPGRRTAGEKLREPEQDLRQAINDLKAMVLTDPWKVGLAGARVAKERLSGENDNIDEQQWYRAIKAVAAAQGERAVAEADWYDALMAYFALSKLDPDSEELKEKVKTVRKHVRVLGLYGNGQGDSTAVSTQPHEDVATWKEIVAGVDGRMVKDAISELDQYYVGTIDYRKMARGALNSIQVLTETPQAAKTFPGLSDDTGRKKFLQAVDETAGFLEQKDRVDHMDVQLALNNILSASKRTVDIPLDVLAVEFAEGMIDELDEFSSVIWPHDVQDFRKHTIGKFHGVGIHITKEPGEALKVVAPLPGSPAYREGIRPGDLIMAVDGRRTESASIDKLVRMITGEKGTRVVLTIKSPGELVPKDVSIIREEIRVPTVRGWRRMEDGSWDFLIDRENRIGYIRITQFTDQTPKDIAKQLEQLKNAQVRSLVLDMRDNPGGLLRSATKVVDEFLSEGLVVSTKGYPRPTEVKAGPGGKYLDGDLVLLVNRRSASAAEIVAGAIKDWKRGTIIGERTFGKGSVQHVIPIRSRGAYLKLTTAHYYLPHGRLLHRQNSSKTWGVDPDIEVHLTPKQTRRWSQIRQKTEMIDETTPEELEKALADQLEVDLQLNTAVVLLRLMQLRSDKLAA